MELFSGGPGLYLLGHVTFPSTLGNRMVNVHKHLVTSPQCLQKTNVFIELDEATEYH